jgi:CxxC motif-containing protein
MVNKEYICIACPIGCHLSLEIKENNEIKVSGNKCKRGIVYAQEEYLAPKRVVTATCQTNSKIYTRIPVKTDNAILKEHINDLIKEIYKLNLKVPVKRGSVVITNFKGSGVNVLTTRGTNN